MMNQETFNLTWNDFEKCTIDSFKELLKQDEFVDVSFVSEDDKQSCLKEHSDKKSSPAPPNLSDWCQVSRT